MDKIIIRFNGKPVVSTPLLLTWQNIHGKFDQPFNKKELSRSSNILSFQLLLQFLLYIGVSGFGLQQAFQGEIYGFGLIVAAPFLLLCSTWLVVKLNRRNKALLYRKLNRHAVALVRALKKFISMNSDNAPQHFDVLVQDPASVINENLADVTLLVDALIITAYSIDVTEGLTADDLYIGESLKLDQQISKQVKKLKEAAQMFGYKPAEEDSYRAVASLRSRRTLLV